MKPRTELDSEPPVSVQSHPHTIDCDDAHRDTIESPIPPASVDPEPETVREGIFGQKGPARTSKRGIDKEVLKRAKAQQLAEQVANEAIKQTPATPEQVQKKTRFPLAMALGTSFFIAGVGGTVGYAYLTKDKKDTIVDTNHQKADPDIDGYQTPDYDITTPDDLKKPEDLKALIDAKAIEPALSAFDLAPENLHGKMLYLYRLGDEVLEWRPLTEKITEVGEDTIVAVKIVNQAPGMQVTTDGLKPLTIYHDTEKDIYYLAYSCTNQPKKSGEVYGQINVSFRGKPQMFRSIKTGRCSEKNGIHGGAQ